MRLDDGKSVFIDATTIAPGAGRFLVMGDSVLVHARGQVDALTAGQRRAVGALVSYSGVAQVVVPPRGDSAMPSARALFEPNDGWHVVWLRATPAQTPRLQDGVAMYARFDGARWTEPVAISGKQEAFYTYPDLPSRLVRTASGMAIAVPIRPPAGDEGVVIYAREDGRWRERRVPRTRGALYVSLASAANWLVLAYAGPSDGGEIGLFVTRSADGGTSWSVPTAVAKGNVFDPNIVRAGDRFGLSWVGSESMYRPRGIWIAYSDNAGATWGEARATPAGRDATSLATVDLERSALLLLYNEEARSAPHTTLLVRRDSIVVIDSSSNAPIQPIAARRSAEPGDVVVLSSVFRDGDTAPVSTVGHLWVACDTAD